MVSLPQSFYYPPPVWIIFPTSSHMMHDGSKDAAGKGKTVSISQSETELHILQVTVGLLMPI